MKKIKNILCAAIFTLLFSTISNTVQAQNSFGGGLTINGGLANAIGLDARARFGISETLAIGTDLNYISFDGGALIGYNGNVQYILGDTDAFSYYPMAGLNITTFSLGSFGSANVLGLNLGGGGNYMVNDKLSVFSEFKLVMGLDEYVGNRSVLTFGVMFTP